MNWIKVEDELPKTKDDCVKVWVLGEGIDYRLMDYITHEDDDKGRFYFEWRNYWNNHTEQVTHWTYCQPLPEPPNK